MKLKIIIILILITQLFIQSNKAYASNIIEKTSESGIKTYFVSTETDNALVMNLIRFRMETEVNIIYSNKMIPKSKNNLQSYYTNLIFNSSNLYQKDLLSYAYNVGSYNGFGICNTIKYNKKNNTVQVNCKFTYYDTKEQSKYVTDKINKAILCNISKLNTDYDKAKWAYDWVIDNSNYDFNISNLSIFGGLNGDGMVCSGYSILYCAIATRLGLDCKCIEGSVRNEKYNNHMWNIINLNGKWYCVDTTWGDYHGKESYFLKSKDTLSLSKYGYHKSKTYDNYILNGEIFSENDYENNQNLDTYYILPSVYDIEMDLFKNRNLQLGESYLFMLNNVDNVPIYFVSSDDNIAIVNENGIITGKQKGNAIITAYNYDLGIEQKCKIIVN